MQDLAVYCADIGSVKRGRFGWSRIRHGGDQGSQQSSSIQDLVQAVTSDLIARHPTALGFECPLFVPIPSDPQKLTSARSGEGNRPWSAGAGSAALATGLTEVVWILKEIREWVPTTAGAFLDWKQFSEAGEGLFLWEAFVSGEAKAQGGQLHSEDAEIAVRSFLAALPNPTRANAIHEADVHSLIGAALLRTGWTTATELLATPCLVIKT